MTVVYRCPLQALCLVFATPLALPAAAPDIEAARVQEIAAGVYVRAGHPAPLFQAENLANVGFIIGGRCVAVIDTGGSMAEGRALDEAIRTLTDRPVCFVINTHVHPDHMLGNKAFRRSGVQFVGHANLPAAMAARGDNYLRRAAAAAGVAEDASWIVLPERTVSDELQLDLGERMLVLRAYPAAHTDNDVTVFDPQTGTLFLGDLVFLEHVPVLDGSINGWLEQLGRLTHENYRRVVPGHGPPVSPWPEAAAPTVQYLEDLRRQVRKWIADGGDIAEAQDAIEVSRPAPWELVEEYHKGNIAAAFAELEWEE